MTRTTWSKPALRRGTEAQAAASCTTSSAAIEPKQNRCWRQIARASSLWRSGGSARVAEADGARGRCGRRPPRSAPRPERATAHADPGGASPRGDLGDDRRQRQQHHGGHQAVHRRRRGGDAAVVGGDRGQHRLAAARPRAGAGPARRTSGRTTARRAGSPPRRTRTALTIRASPAPSGRARCVPRSSRARAAGAARASASRRRSSRRPASCRRPAAACRFPTSVKWAS